MPLTAKLRNYKQKTFPTWNLMRFCFSCSKGQKLFLALNQACHFAELELLWTYPCEARWWLSLKVSSCSLCMKAASHPNPSQRSAPQKTRTTKFWRYFLGRGVETVFVPDATHFGSIKRMQHNLFFSLCVWQPSPQLVWWQYNDCTHMLRKNTWVTRWLVAWAATSLEVNHEGNQSNNPQALNLHCVFHVIIGRSSNTRKNTQMFPLTAKSLD